MSDKDIDIAIQETGPLLDDIITVDLSGDIGAVGSTMSSTAYQYPTYSIGTTSGFNGTSGSYLTANTASGTSWITNNTSPWSISGPSSSPGLKVTGDAEFEGKVMINGRNISEFMETISKRLAILVPDPEKLAHFEALKKAYEHYKTLEALCQMPKKDEE
jgi:hypothetical protein